MKPNNEQAKLSKWVAGFFDGDGVMSVNVQKDEKSAINYNMTTSCKIEQAYIAGLVDAEGSIGSGVHQDNSAKLEYSLSPHFVFSQANNPGLQKFCKYLEERDISYGRVEQSRDGNRNPVEKISLHGSSNLRAFLTDMKPHLSVKRAQAEIMLNDILPIFERGDHTNRRGFLNVMYHVDRMNAYKGGVRGKYNLEYFEDEWGMEYDG